MKFETVKYSYRNFAINPSSLVAFKKEIDVGPCVYLFFQNNKCKYIGCTKVSLKDRCYRHARPHSLEAWFGVCDEIKIIILETEESGQLIPVKSLCKYVYGN